MIPTHDEDDLRVHEVAIRTDLARHRRSRTLYVSDSRNEAEERMFVYLSAR